MTYETRRLLVRPWTAGDLGSFFAIFGEPEVWRYLPGKAPVDLEAASCLLDRTLTRMRDWRGLGSFAVTERSTEQIVGNVMVRPLADGPEIEIGYHVAMQHWGQGFATEAARGAVRYGFEVLGLKEIFGVVVPDNVASRRVLEKTGLTWLRRGRFYGLDCDLFRIGSTPAPAGSRRDECRSLSDA